MPQIQGASAYRQAAAEGATQIGLLIIAYDALARELSRAGAAAERQDIAVRCKHSSLALTIVGHLESWTDYLEDPALATSLKQFYGFLRARILQMQAHSRFEDFEALVSQVMETRAAWQQKEYQLATTVPMAVLDMSGRARTGDRGPGTSSFSCSG